MKGSHPPAVWSIEQDGVGSIAELREKIGFPIGPFVTRCTIGDSRLQRDENAKIAGVIIIAE